MHNLFVAKFQAFHALITNGVCRERPLARTKPSGSAFPSVAVTA